MLILLPLTITAARLHAHNVESPVAVTQEVNRCLFFVRTAASRRGEAAKGDPAKRKAARPCAYYPGRLEP